MSDITELNVITGEETTRKYTKKEKDFIASISIDGKEELNAMIVAEQQKRILKEESLQVLQNLGLTEDQAKAIAGL
jgi:hypothetical protein